jgi:hypothetical protein
MNQSKTGNHNQSGCYKKIGFIKINHEKFKWGRYQAENAESFYVAWRKHKLHFNKGDSMSTESTRSEIPHQLSQLGMMKSSYMLVSSALTQLTWSLTPRRPSVRKMNQSKTGIHNQSGGFKKIGFIKINHEKFKWGRYQAENAESFYVAWRKHKLHFNWVSAEWQIIRISMQIRFYIQNEFRVWTRGQVGSFDEKERK